MTPGPEVAVRHVLLDRDGVLDREPAEGWLRSAAAWEWERGALAAVGHLAQAGVAVSVVTNQSGVGRGIVDRADAEAVNAWLAAELVRRGVRLVGVYACYHAPSDGCRCRKPAPALVQGALAAAATAPGEALLIGDDHRDLEAGTAAGTAVALVRTGKGAAVEATARWTCPVFDDVGAAVRSLVPGGR